MQKLVAAGDIFDAEMDSSDDDGGENDRRTPERNDNVALDNKGKFVSSGMGIRFPTNTSQLGKRKSIYIAPFIYYVYLKALRHGSHSFTCKYTMPAFPS